MASARPMREVRVSTCTGPSVRLRCTATCLASSTAASASPSIRCATASALRAVSVSGCSSPKTRTRAARLPVISFMPLRRLPGGQVRDARGCPRRSACRGGRRPGSTGTTRAPARRAARPRRAGRLRSARPRLHSGPPTPAAGQTPGRSAPSRPTPRRTPALQALTRAVAAGPDRRHRYRPRAPDGPGLQRASVPSGRTSQMVTARPSRPDELPDASAWCVESSNEVAFVTLTMDVITVRRQDLHRDDE